MNLQLCNLNVFLTDVTGLIVFFHKWRGFQDEQPVTPYKEALLGVTARLLNRILHLRFSAASSSSSVDPSLEQSVLDALKKLQSEMSALHSSEAEEGVPYSSYVQQLINVVLSADSLRPAAQRLCSEFKFEVADEKTAAPAAAPEPEPEVNLLLWTTYDHQQIHVAHVRAYEFLIFHIGEFRKKRLHYGLARCVPSKTPMLCPPAKCAAATSRQRRRLRPSWSALPLAPLVLPRLAMVSARARKRLCMTCLPCQRLFAT